MAKTKTHIALLLIMLLAACSRAPQTPIDQEAFTVLPSAGPGPIYLTAKEVPADARVLNRTVHEFRRHRLRIAIVWQTPNPPTNEQLAAFPGRYIRQYHDPNRSVPSTKGNLMVYGELVPIDNPVALRVALAKATLR